MTSSTWSRTASSSSGSAAALKSSPRVAMRAPRCSGRSNCDQIGEVCLVQRKRQLAHFRRVALIEGGDDGVQEIGAESALFVAQFDLACGVLHGLFDRQS